jgi:hypothetical protein
MIIKYCNFCAPRDRRPVCQPQGGILKVVQDRNFHRASSNQLPLTHRAVVVPRHSPLRRAPSLNRRRTWAYLVLAWLVGYQAFPLKRNLRFDAKRDGPAIAPPAIPSGQIGLWPFASSKPPSPSEIGSSNRKT